MSASFKKFWNFDTYQEKEWFRILGIMLLSLTGLYIVLHLLLSCFDKKYAFEYTKLDANQIQQINRIYFDTANKTQDISEKKILQKTDQSSSDKKNPIPTKIDKKEVSSKDSTKILKDSIQKDYTVKPDLSTSTTTEIPSPTKDSCKCNNKSCEQVIRYLKIEFPGNITSGQIDSLKLYLCSASNIEATTFLSNLKLKASSYFWLTGAPLYIEIIFWTLFGVLCSLLFNIGVIAQKSTNNPQDSSTYFDNSEIPSQIAKLFYAPLCTLVIVLGYNLLGSQNPVDISAGKGVLVFAFIGGYYSSRLISFLDRFKDLLLPNSGSADTPKVPQPSLKNIVISLILPNGINPETIDPTTIALTDKKTGDKINASKLNDNPTIFIADFVKPAKYTIAEFTFQTKNNAGAIVQLKSTITDVEMKTADLFISLALTVQIP